MLKNRYLYSLFYALLVSFFIHSFFIVSVRPELKVPLHYFDISYWGSFLTTKEIALDVRRMNKYHYAASMNSKIYYSSQQLVPFAKSLNHYLFSSREVNKAEFWEGKEIRYADRNKGKKNFYFRNDAGYLRFIYYPGYLLTSSLSLQRKTYPFAYVPLEEKMQLDELLSHDFDDEYLSPSKSSKLINVRVLISPVGKVMFVQFSDYPWGIHKNFSLYYWLQGLIFEAKGRREWINLKINLEDVQMQF